MKQLLWILGIIIWPLWVISAMIKDLVLILYVPFDSQRFINTFGAVVANFRKLPKILLTDPEPAHENQDEPETPKPQIGFKSFARVNCEDQSDIEDFDEPEEY